MSYKDTSRMRNKPFYDLYMDFAKLRDNKIFPCDIDMFYECNDGFIIIGEAKLRGHHVERMQEKVLTHLIDGHKNGGILLEIQHDEKVQDGKERVDIADCTIFREYYDGKWHICEKPDTVLERMLELIQEHKTYPKRIRSTL